MILLDWIFCFWESCFLSNKIFHVEYSKRLEVFVCRAVTNGGDAQVGCLCGFPQLCGQAHASFPYNLDPTNGWHVLLWWPPNPSSFRWSVVDDSWVLLFMLIWYHIFQCHEPGTPDVALSSTFWGHITHVALPIPQLNVRPWMDTSICSIDWQDIKTLPAEGEGICQTKQK